MLVFLGVILQRVNKRFVLCITLRVLTLAGERDVQAADLPAGAHHLHHLRHRQPELLRCERQQTTISNR